MKEGQDWSAVSFIVQEAKDQAQLLLEWRVTKVRRESDLVANDLAHNLKNDLAHLEKVLNSALLDW